MLFSAAITVAAFVPLFTMQGVEGQIFGPMARTYGYALAGALIATFTVTPVLASLLLPQHVKEVETFVVRGLREAYAPALRLGARAGRSWWSASGWLSRCWPACWRRSWAASSCRRSRKATSGSARRMPPTISLDAGTEATRKMREILLQPSGSHHRRLAARPAGQRQRRLAVLQRRAVRAAEALRPMAGAADQGEADRASCRRSSQAALPGVAFNFSQYIQDNVEEAISGVKGANSVKIIGPNLDVLEELADQVMAQMAQVRGVEDLGIFHVLGQPNLNIKIDRAKAARYGLNTGRCQHASSRPPWAARWRRPCSRATASSI